MYSNKMLILLLVAVTWLYVCKFLERSPDLTGAEIAISVYPQLQEEVVSIKEQIEGLKVELASKPTTYSLDQTRLNKIEGELAELSAGVHFLLRQNRKPKDPITEPLMDPIENSGRRQTIPEVDPNFLHGFVPGH